MELLGAILSVFVPCTGFGGLEAFCSERDGLRLLSGLLPLGLLGLVFAVSGSRPRYFLPTFFVALAGLFFFNALIHLWANGWMMSYQFVGFVAAIFLGVCLAFSRVARRVAARAFPVTIVLGLAGLAIVLALAPELDPSDEDDVKIIQAVIAGALVASGWIVTFSIQELRTEQARKKKEEEMLIALAFEIINTLKAEFMNWARFEKNFDQILAKPPAGKDPFFPFFPSVKPNSVFDAMTADMPLLSRTPLSKVIIFYAQAADVAAITEDLKVAVQQNLDKERGARIYLAAYEMRRSLLRYGLKALKAINDELPYWSEVDFSRTKNKVETVLSEP